MSNKISPILVTHFMGNESQNVFQKIFWQSVQKPRRAGKREYEILLEEVRFIHAII